MGGVSVSDEMSPRQSAQTHTRPYGGEAGPTLRMGRLYEGRQSSSKGTS